MINVDELTRVRVTAVKVKADALQKELNEKREAINRRPANRELLRQEIRNLNSQLMKLYHEIESIKISAFITALAEKYGVADNPKFTKAYELAWEFGHSSGFNEVENYFMGLVELIK